MVFCWVLQEIGSTTLVGRTRRSVVSAAKERARKARAVPLSVMKPERLWKWEQMVSTSKEDWKWQRGITLRPLSESNCWKSHFCQSDGGIHVVTDGSLVGVSVKWGACGWSVQLDHDEEMGPMHGMYGTLDAEFGGSAYHQKS